MTHAEQRLFRDMLIKLAIIVPVISILLWWIA